MVGILVAILRRIARVAKAANDLLIAISKENAVVKLMRLFFLNEILIWTWPILHQCYPYSLGGPASCGPDNGAHFLAQHQSASHRGSHHAERHHMA